MTIDGAGQNTDRRADQGAQTDHHQTADDRIEQAAAITARRWRVLCQQAEIERAKTLDHQRQQNPGQHHQAERHRQEGKQHADPMLQQAPPVYRIHRAIHGCRRCRCCSLID